MDPDPVNSYPPDPVDPTRLRDQPALTRSRGRSWIVMGSLFTAFALVVLIPMTTLPPPGVALAGAIIVTAGFLTILASRLLVPESRLRRRLGIMAIALLTSAAAGLVAAGIVAIAAANELASTQ